MKQIINRTLITSWSLFVFLSCSSDSGNGGPDEPMENPIENNVAPSTPSLIYPSNELVCIDNELEFEWNASTDEDGDPITYYVEVAYDRDFLEMVEAITTNELTRLFLLDKGETLYWRARASDDESNFSNYSSIWRFYTEAEPEANQLPSQPELLNPAIDTIVTGLTADLTWNTSDGDGDPLIYDLYFGINENPPLHEEGYENSTYTISIEAGNTYYWKIVSKDNRGGVSIGPIWSFSAE